MITAVDTNIFSTIWSGGPASPALESALSAARTRGSIIISGAVFAEMLAYPAASEEFVRGFLAQTGVRLDSVTGDEVWAEAGRRYARYAARRQRSLGEPARRILADFLIGAHAILRADRLLTLHQSHYRTNFPELPLLS